jgi:Plasmid pRiA4b ORF-3-like protein
MIGNSLPVRDICRIGVVSFYFGLKVHTLRVSQLYVQPEVWRRIVVASDMSLTKFATALERSMGWDCTHRHLFDVAGVLFGNTQHDPPHLIDERVATVNHLLSRAGCLLKWDYDLGDNWKHDVVVEAIEPLDPKKKYPIITEGERACPPEDCGGSSGFEELLRVPSDPTDEEHEFMADWGPKGFDPEAFDLVAPNRRLRAK